MQITATINGFANGNNECAGFAVHVESDTSQDHDRTIPLMPMTINQAELAAAQYACLAVHPQIIPLADIEIRTCNPYLAGVAEKVDGKWKVNPKTNVDLVSKVRTTFERFKSVVVKLDSDSELMAELKVKARSYNAKANADA